MHDVFFKFLMHRCTSRRAAHNYACTVAHSAALRAGGVAADGLMFDTMIGADLRDCMLVPEGLILASNWDVDYNCWKVIEPGWACMYPGMQECGLP